MKWILDRRMRELQWSAFFFL